MVKRALLHSLDKIFRPVDPSDSSFRQEPASIKKLLKGDGTWSTRKIILGWLIDTVEGSLRLPPHRIARLHEILDSISPSQRFVAVRHWQKVLGELRSMSIAIPGAQGLFSVLQEAFRHLEKNRPRLRLTSVVHDFLADLKLLASDVASRPTMIDEIIPSRIPDVVSACDAAGVGMGGVHFVPLDSGDVIPLVWRAPFPRNIQRRLVSFANPNGDITNSDLELAGNLTHFDVLSECVDVAGKTIQSFSDNTPTVFWSRKGSATTIGPAAYLLRLQALHRRLFRYVPLVDFIPGVVNAMADFASRSWHLTDEEFLIAFNRLFPQKLPWRLCHVRSEMNSSVISSLRRKRSDPALLRPTPTKKIRIGKFGSTSACCEILIRSSKTFPIRSPSWLSSLPSSETVDLPPAVDASTLARWRTPFARWDRRSPAWGPAIRASTN
jgi:hypothetical protein